MAVTDLLLARACGEGESLPSKFTHHPKFSTDINFFIVTNDLYSRISEMAPWSYARPKSGLGLRFGFGVSSVFEGGGMKKLILIAILVALGVVAAKKVRSA